MTLLLYEPFRLHYKNTRYVTPAAAVKCAVSLATLTGTGEKWRLASAHAPAPRDRRLSVRRRIVHAASVRQWPASMSGASAQLPQTRTEEKTFYTENRYHSTNRDNL